MALFCVCAVGPVAAARGTTAPRVCSSRCAFTSNLLGVGNWTPNWGATQNWGDVNGTRFIKTQI
ncbi:hypothetical protein DYQ48_00445 [Xanthomonas hortorum]|nr:hypothetical protein DYQ48_00445 [Xanthomonas hortorum]